MSVPGTVGDLLTRAAVWLAVLGYAIGVCLLLDRTQTRDRPARVAWTLGCAFFVIHVCLAFHYFYAWSHQTGIEATAIKTEAMVSVRRGEGLYFNYVFAVSWICDSMWWWIVGQQRYRARSHTVALSLHAFMAFMVFNGTVIFGSGPVRVFGLFLTGLVIFRFIRFRVRT